MHYTKSIGSFIELQCIAKFISIGYDCSIPYGDAARYDFIVDLKEKGLKKIQCKSATLAKKPDGTLDDAICIKLKSPAGEYTEEDVDYFMTYYNNQIYVIPIKETSGQTKTLRFSPPQKKTNAAYNKAEDYKFEKFFSINQELENSKKDYFEIMNTKKEEKYFCDECGKEITKFSKSGLCEDCAHKKQRIVERPNREELKNMIRIISFTKIGEKFNVSDNTIRKWCDSEKLPKTKKEINSYSDEEWSKL